VRASEGGKIGEVIELENIDSGNLVLGMVVDIGKVELLN
jgi:flagella basal body P-ring formation protein FlgA